jgi:alpha-L-glutamate ligase-like protein
MKMSYILGLNARSQLYSYPLNKVRGRSIASSKIKTKRLLRKFGVPVPEIYAKFTKPEKIMKFDWESLPFAFALKPSRGLGGEGIVVAKKKDKETPDEGGLGFTLFKKKGRSKVAWITTQKERVTDEDLKLHVLDILEGAYSVGNIPDTAFIEEYVGRHKALRRYSYRGTPDVRVIVFNRVPVMAMLRLPTKESGARANLHQGAVAVGVDIATGVTTKAYWHGRYIRYKPGSKRKLNGIKIPMWNRILEIAIQAGDAASLGYYGADVVLHPEKGPMVLELNYQPGLSIQLANGAGLRKRLERVEDIKVLSPEHGVKIARALFVADFSDRVKAEEGVKTISAIEEITIKGINKTQRKKAMAKIDTGAWRTSINYTLAEELGLLRSDNILWSKKIRSSLGTEDRPVISVTFWLSGRKIKTVASVAKRGSLKFPVIIGRRDLRGFLIDAHIPLDEKLQKVKKAKELE